MVVKKRRSRKVVLAYSAVGLAVLLAAFCANGLLRHHDLWGLRPLPVIRGTDQTVPRDWLPSQPPRPWHWIVIHHSATGSGDADLFDSWHRERGWDELGYHFVINNGDGGGDGEVEVGGRWHKQKQGAHAKSPDGKYNERGIGICLVGNFEDTSPTAAQWQALVKLTTFLAREYQVPPERIIGHRDVNDKTLCPGKNMDLNRLRREVWFE